MSVKDDRKEINFDPKDLLKQIATIYVHLSMRDKGALLAQAIVSDKRSYYPEMFPDALKVSIQSLTAKGFLCEGKLKQTYTTLLHVHDFCVTCIEYILPSSKA